MLVELRNRPHLTSAYGAEVADEVVSQLQLRVFRLGGDACVLDPSTLLVALPDQGGEVDQCGMELDERMERWQLSLSAWVGVKGGSLRVLPVISLARARTVEIPADLRGQSSLGPWALEFDPLDEVQYLAPVGRGAQWRESYVEDMELAIRLHDHLAAGELSLEFQPIVHVHDHSEVLYLESLLRLSNPQTRLPSVSLGGAIPTMERLGLVRALDRVVVLSLVRWLETHPTVRVGCNVSALSLVNDSWWVSIMSRLERGPEIARRLTFEITETAGHYDGVAATAFVRRLQALGCEIALDDIGAGYTSFAFMRSVRPEIAKLDASLIRGARVSSGGQALLASVTGVCRAVASHVVAEGIEDPLDLYCAARAGADCVQGFAVGVPAPMGKRLTLSGADDFTGGAA